MAINPLELQTLFSQINNVGKMQSVNKEAELLKQEIANSEISKKSEKNSEDVPETKNIDSDSSKINDKKEQNKKNKKENKNEQNEGIKEEDLEEQKVENKKSKSDFLGTKIDILG